jgi:hypothetical protein
MQRSKGYSTATESDLTAIRVAAQDSDYFYERVRFLCNAIGPRPSGSPQAAAAVEYVRRQMRDLGLEARLEPVTVRHWVRGREEARLIRYSGQIIDTNQKVVITALGNSGSTPPEGLSAPVIVVETFEQLARITSDEVAGKVVLFNHRFDEFSAQAGNRGSLPRCPKGSRRGAGSLHRFDGSAPPSYGRYQIRGRYTADSSGRRDCRGR